MGTDFSDNYSRYALGIFRTYFYNHARRLRLEKQLCIELSRSSNGYFEPLPDPAKTFLLKALMTPRLPFARFVFFIQHRKPQRHLAIYYLAISTKIIVLANGP
jgi:hypothetical protein